MDRRNFVFAAMGCWAGSLAAQSPRGTLSKGDEGFLREAIEASFQASRSGNEPFGAVLVGRDGKVLAVAENSVVTEHDMTMHAESNVIRAASRAHGSDALKNSTLYTSTEPCAMCSGAIHWAGITRVVYACSEATLGKIAGDDFLFPCREVLGRSKHPVVEVVGPVLEDEAVKAHTAYWRK
jgi:tRNA(Arg) A34 adenosine deaminase TadA